jgi:ABC-type oligopeptide transport system substrate-binding subunit
VLVANPNYWDANYPKIEKITVYTELDTKIALENVLDKEGVLDIMPIPFSMKCRAGDSPHAKLITVPSTNNIAINMNLRNGHKRLLEKRVRVALNQAIDQAHLLKRAYHGEGMVKPTLAAPLFPGVREVVKTLRPYSEIQSPKEIRDELKEILDGLTLKVLTQDRFMFIWKGIARDLRKVGVKLEFEITTSEKTRVQPTARHQRRKKHQELGSPAMGIRRLVLQSPMVRFSRLPHPQLLEHHLPRSGTGRLCRFVVSHLRWNGGIHCHLWQDHASCLRQCVYAFCSGTQ